MLKARADGLLVFGLSAVNVARLKDGQPILVNLEELGLTGKVIIFYGETEESMRTELADLIGPETAYRDDTGRKN